MELFAAFWSWFLNFVVEARTGSPGQSRGPNCQRDQNAWRGGEGAPQNHEREPGHLQNRVKKVSRVDWAGRDQTHRTKESQGNHGNQTLPKPSNYALSTPNASKYPENQNFRKIWNPQFVLILTSFCYKALQRSSESPKITKSRR